MKNSNTPTPSREAQSFAARQLLAGSFHGVLSTHSVEHEGFPFGSVVPYALDAEGVPLLLLSNIAQHTHNLLENGNCCLTVQENPHGDIQTQSRLCCLAEFTPVTCDEVKIGNRFLRYFPQQRPYYEELNFHFYLLQPVRHFFNSGFGTARWLSRDSVQRPNPLAEVIELELIEQLHQAGHTTVVGCDREGVDLRLGEQLLRKELDQAAASVEELPTLLMKRLEQD